jgi:hypothetical protein
VSDQLLYVTVSVTDRESMGSFLLGFKVELREFKTIIVQLLVHCVKRS